MAVYCAEPTGVVSQPLERSDREPADRASQCHCQGRSRSSLRLPCWPKPRPTQAPVASKRGSVDFLTMLASSAASSGQLERSLAKVKGVFLQLLTLSLEQEATTSVSAVVASELLSWAQLISMPLGVTLTLSKNLNSQTPWALRPLLTALAVVNPDEIRDLLGNTAYVVVLALSIA